MKIASWIMSGSTVIVAFNGALQKRFILPEKSCVVPGNVHRAKTVQIGVGGKGQDVAIALSCLGYTEPTRLAQFLGSGAEGDLVYDLLKDKLGDIAMSLTVRPKSSLRTCTSIVASDATTELVEPSGVIEEEEIGQLMDRLKKLGDGSVAAICIMGTMPPGCPPNSYAEIYKQISGVNTLCIIDSVIGIDHILATIAGMEEHGPSILKINASELCKIVQIKKTSETDRIVIDDLINAASKFLSNYASTAIKALSGIAITDGKHPAYLIAIEETKFQLYEIPVASIPSDRTVFPIGAGDAVAAGTLAAWRCLAGGKDGKSCLSTEVQQKLEDSIRDNDEIISNPLTQSMLTSFAFGLACGSASCLEEQNSVLQVEQVLNLYWKQKPQYLSTHKI